MADRHSMGRLVAPSSPGAPGLLRLPTGGSPPSWLPTLTLTLTLTLNLTLTLTLTLTPTLALTLT